MNYKKIVQMALDEALFGDSESATGRKVNDDGTITLSIGFEIDPAVSEEMAKAMPKGQTREDQSDVDLDEADDNKAVAAEDEDPQRQQRKSVRHSDTPIENCRAKDPMYCPYHGLQVMNRMLADEFKDRGIEGTVEVSGGKGKFNVSFTVPAQDEQTALAVVDNLLMTKKGVKKTSNAEYKTDNDGLESKMTAGGEVERGQGWQKAKVGEWVDNIISRLAADPDAKKEVRRSDFDDMLGKVGALYDVADAADSQPGDANLKAAADAAYESARSAIFDLAAMIDYRDVKTMDDAKQISDPCVKEIADAKATYEPAAQRLNASKVAAFGGKGAFPKGFKEQNPWAAARTTPKYSDYSNTGHIVSEAESDMRAVYGALQGVGVIGNGDLNYAQKKSLRCALRDIESATDMIVGHAARNEKTTNELIAKLDEWKANQANVAAAAPAQPKRTRKRTAKAAQVAPPEQQQPAQPADQNQPNE